jgi:hypothetical protein
VEKVSIDNKKKEECADKEELKSKSKSLYARKGIAKNIGMESEDG